MNLQIDTIEFEESQETKLAAMRSKVQGTMERLNYLDNVYKQKEIGVQKREKNLQVACGTWLGVTIAWFLLGEIIYALTSDSVWGYAFSIMSIWICIFVAIVFLFATIRIWASLFTHMMKLTAPVRLIYNRRYKSCTLQDLQRYGIYTLTEEKRDCKSLIGQVAENRKRLQNYLDNPDSTVEEGEKLLSGMESQLEENDRRATVLYGERV